jgi:hypothetical protein
MDFMPLDKKDLREVLRLAIKTLTIQEVRVLQLERATTPSFIIDEMARSIQEAKREIISLVRLMPSKERNVFIKRLIRQSIDEEIDQGVQVRKNKCFRCIHVRYFDEEGSPYVNLPIGIGQVQIMGCDEIRTASKGRCRRFVERARATSLEDYLSEMALFYELREMFKRFEEIWRDYFLSI